MRLIVSCLCFTVVVCGHTCFADVEFKRINSAITLPESLQNQIHEDTQVDNIFPLPVNVRNALLLESSIVREIKKFDELDKDVLVSRSYYLSSSELEKKYVAIPEHKLQVLHEKVKSYLQQQQAGIIKK